jgi:hypothetical protein
MSHDCSSTFKPSEDKGGICGTKHPKKHETARFSMPEGDPNQQGVSAKGFPQYDPVKNKG